MLREDVCNKDQLHHQRRAIQNEIQKAFDFAESAPFPANEEAFRGLYVDDT